MEISLSTVKSIDRNMDNQNSYVKEILGLIDECETAGLLDDISETEIRQLRDHCDNIAMAANTTKKFVKNYTPVAEEADKKKKAESEAKKKDAAKRKATKAEEQVVDNVDEKAEEVAETDDDMDFLG